MAAASLVAAGFVAATAGAPSGASSGASPPGSAAGQQRDAPSGPSRRAPPAVAPLPGESAGLASIVVGECILIAPVSERGRLESLAERARAILPRVEADLGASATAPYRVFLIPAGGTADGMLRILDAAAPPWASGFMIPERRTGAIRVALADRYPNADEGSVLAHEATHMILHDAAGPDLPRWFGEGVASGIERSWGMRDVLVYSSSILTGRLPPLSELDAAFDASDERARAAYAASFDFVLWSVRTYGPGIVRDVVVETRRRSFPEAWRAATGKHLEESEAAWRRGSLLLYRWVPALTGTTALWSGITALALLAGARRRARTRRLLEAWDREDPRPGRATRDEPPGPEPPRPEPSGPDPSGPDPPDEVVH